MTLIYLELLFSLLIDTSVLPFNFKFRAPEEYKMDLQSEKIDVFSLGNAIYGIVTGKYPFHDLEMKEAQRRVMDGDLPPLKRTFLKSDDMIDKALIHAMDMCFEYDWHDRAKASDVRDYLLQVQNQIMKQSES